MNLYRLFGTQWNSLFRTGCICLMVSLLAITMMETSHASEITEQFIQNALNEGYEILNDETLSEDVRTESFACFLDGIVDFRRTALFTIGTYANRSSPGEIEDFVGSFRRYITATVKSNLEAVRDYTLVLRGSTDRAIDDSIVLVALTQEQTAPDEAFQAAFRVRNDATGNPIIIDIQFEGIWLAITDRADYTSFLARNGGELSSLSRFLDDLALENAAREDIPE
jgi:phospholipid transport system substrate-binding protein